VSTCSLSTRSWSTRSRFTRSNTLTFDHQPPPPHTHPPLQVLRFTRFSCRSREKTETKIVVCARGFPALWQLGRASKPSCHVVRTMPSSPPTLTIAAADATTAHSPPPRATTTHSQLLFIGSTSSSNKKLLTSRPPPPQPPRLCTYSPLTTHPPTHTHPHTLLDTLRCSLWYQTVGTSGIHPGKSSRLAFTISQTQS
jgi:hypothetical protein